MSDIGKVLGPILEIGANFVGANQDKQAQKGRDMQAFQQWEENNRLQKEFAQNGIRWKVEDARAAGIAPLAALGANTMSFSPSTIGSSGGASSSQAWSNLGQNISRSIDATRTQEEREHARLMTNLQLENQSLQNEYLRSQIHQINKPMVGPPLPSPMDQGPMAGQGDMPISMKRATITASQPGVPQQEAGAINDYGFVRTSNGYVPVPSRDVKERTEDNLLQEAMWAVRNNLLPNFGGGPKPPDPKYYPLPKGAKEWVWDPRAQAFVPDTHLSKLGSDIRRFKNNAIPSEPKFKHWSEYF